LDRGNRNRKSLTIKVADCNRDGYEGDRIPTLPSTAAKSPFCAQGCLFDRGGIGHGPQ
jgi:hypothetical protein